MIKDATFIPSDPDLLRSTVEEQRERFQHSDQVFENRKIRFQSMGFMEYIADFLASTRIDPYMMEDLLKRGCEHTTAIEILIGTMWSGNDPLDSYPTRNDD